MSVEPSRKRSKTARLATAGIVGTTLEYYDFFIYGTSAALVFGTLFFPSYSPLTATLLAFATFAAGFLARPIGSILFGHLGDRVGRRSTLIFSLVLMGICTTLIGCLPTEPQIGAAAPILLVVLRFAQGIALGGEWSGSSLLLVEHAPQNRRGLFGSFTQMGAPGGLVLATLAINGATALTGDQFAVWGWRLPFLFSAVLLIVSLFIRLGIDESPVFTALEKTEKTKRAPISDVFRKQWRDIALAAGIVAPGSVLFYVVSTYSISYATTIVQMPSTSVLSALLTASIIYFFTIPVFGLISDLISRRAVLLLGCLLSIPTVFLLFVAINTGSLVLTFIAIAFALAVVHAALQAPQAALFASKFDPRVRYSGVAMSQALSVSIMGGTAPFLAVLFYGWTGSTLLISLWMVLWGLIGAAAVIALVRRPVYVDSTDADVATTAVPSSEAPVLAD